MLNLHMENKYEFGFGKRIMEKLNWCDYKFEMVWIWIYYQIPSIWIAIKQTQCKYSKKKFENNEMFTIHRHRGMWIKVKHTNG